MKILPLEKYQATESVRWIYDALERDIGRVVNFWKMLAHKPGVLGAFLEFDKQVWAPGALSPKIKELAYLRVSLMNGCEYSSRAHTAAAKGQGVTDEQIQALKEPGGLGRNVFSTDERAAIQFAERLTAWPGSIRQTDIDALATCLNAEQIMELVLIVGMVNLTNRFHEGLKTPEDL